MPRKTRRPPPYVLTATPRASRIPLWLSLLLTAVVAALVAAGGMYFELLRPLQHRDTQLTKQIAALAAPTAPGDLTSGLSPAEAARNLGNWYEDHQEWPQAIANYSLAIADGLDNPDIRTDLGVGYYKSGQPEKALEQYRIAQKENPQHENSLYNEGAALAVMNKVPQAVAAWQAYLQRFPQGQHVADARQLIDEIQMRPLSSAAGHSEGVPPVNAAQ